LNRSGPGRPCSLGLPAHSVHRDIDVAARIDTDAGQAIESQRPRPPLLARLAGPDAVALAERIGQLVLAGMRCREDEHLLTPTVVSDIEAPFLVDGDIDGNGVLRQRDLVRERLAVGCVMRETSRGAA